MTDPLTSQNNDPFSRIMLYSNFLDLDPFFIITWLFCFHRLQINSGAQPLSYGGLFLFINPKEIGDIHYSRTPI